MASSTGAVRCGSTSPSTWDTSIHTVCSPMDIGSWTTSPFTCISWGVKSMKLEQYGLYGSGASYAEFELNCYVYKYTQCLVPAASSTNKTCATRKTIDLKSLVVQWVGVVSSSGSTTNVAWCNNGRRRRNRWSATTSGTSCTTDDFFLMGASGGGTSTDTQVMPCKTFFVMFAC